MTLINKIGIVSSVLWATTSFAAPNETQLAVWANEAIVATYTFNYQNFMARQREIAKYFTAEGWTTYSTALLDSQLPDAVAKNKYYVSAVATLPPEIKTLGENHWQATMPLLVIYKNPQYQQKQTLKVIINFGVAPSGQGVRGLSINNLQSSVSESPCECQPAPDVTSPTNGNPSSPNEPQSKPVKGQ
ncbi:MAG: DotI/IcmL family type IV secretion protein [Legionella sp.]|nr:DotI/IcmL family type IV secretion protein [Legionella sp.]